MREISTLKPVTHWRRFRIRRRASMPGDSAGRARATRYQRLYSHTSNTRTQQFSGRCAIYGKASTREEKSSKWLHPVSSPIKTIIWCSCAAGVDAVMLRSVEKANESRRTVWKHGAVSPQKPLRLIRDGKVVGSGILYLTPTRSTVTTRMILN